MWEDLPIFSPHLSSGILKSDFCMEDYPLDNKASAVPEKEEPDPTLDVDTSKDMLSFLQETVPSWNKLEVKDKDIWIRLMATFKGEKRLAHKVLNFVATHLNKETLRGSINLHELRELYPESSDSVAAIILHEELDKKAPSRDDWPSYFDSRKVVLEEVNALMYLLYSRVYEGRDYQAHLREIDSKKTDNVTYMGR